MPLPKPTPSQLKDKEGQKAFISSCVSNQKVRDEFKTNDRIVAVCYSLYKQAKKKNKSNGSNEEPNWKDVETEIEKNKAIIVD